jgi:hypothetical protein
VLKHSQAVSQAHTATDILKGQAVLYVAGSGSIEPVNATGDALSGAFAGVEWTDTTGRRRVSNYWPANTAYQTGSCVAYFYNDPNIVYEIQADGSVAQTSIGLDANLSNFAAGSNVTGLSTSNNEQQLHCQHRCTRSSYKF